jgi:hypothetical protein
MEISPGVGVGQFRFGSTRFDLQRSLSVGVEQFRRTRESKGVTLACDSLGVHLEFDSEDRLSAISVYQPQHATLGGTLLTARPIAEVIQDLVKRGLRPEKVDAGVWIGEAGLLLIDVEGTVDGVTLTAMNHGSANQASD